MPNEKHSRRTRIVQIFGRFVWVGFVALLVGCQSKVVSSVEYSELQLERFTHSVVVNPILLEGNPYLTNSLPLIPTDPSSVCAIHYENIERTRYTLTTFSSVFAAEQAGAFVTHHSPCGTCSTLQDLAVYLRVSNLTTPVRRCAAVAVIKSAGMSCLRDLGFSESCAATWYYNTRHTLRHCGMVCMKSWLTRQAPNLPNGELNACLACDEVKSGPVFKQVAGRTRRNSGIESAIQRQASERIKLEHNY